MNADEKEIDKFDRLAEIWWDPRGEMGTLHRINPLRLRFILQALNVRDLDVLDVGCGGGILSEAMAKVGARSLGIDLSTASLQAARHHAAGQDLQLEYRLETVEELGQKHPATFDAVTCMEMLEHVPDPRKTVAACSDLLKPGGHAFFSSINRTPKAWLFAIFGGEYILRLLPRGSHSYRKLIRPAELKSWAQENGLRFVALASLIYNPFMRTFTTIDGKEDVNYMAHFIKE